MAIKKTFWKQVKRTEQRAERTDLKIRDKSQNWGVVLLEKNISELIVICKNARATKGLNNSVQEKKSMWKMS